MSWIMASAVASRLGGVLVGDDVGLSCVSTDTRIQNKGALFFALKGPSYDAHAALEQCAGSVSSVAAVLVVSRVVECGLPYILVDDTKLALAALAASWRSDYSHKVIGLTGSNGKTTVKEMLASIFAEAGSVHATRGNYNNDIGVPLTLLDLRLEHDVAIIEMGANHAGEIGYLTGLVRPDIALLNNAGAAHLEGFGSLEGVAHAKAEIYSGLSPEGVAIINLDDDFAPLWLEMASTHKQITFGRSNNADVRLLSANPLKISVGTESFTVVLSLLGKHNAMNAAAATAVAYAAGLPLTWVAKGLEKMKPVDGRLFQYEGLGGSRIIDDSYNANPDSIHAAIDALMDQNGEHVLVLGDMAEVGSAGEKMHQELGRYASHSGVAILLAFGSMMRAAVVEFGVGGQHFKTQDALVTELETILNERSVVLIKGSRSMAMNEIVERLRAPMLTNNKGALDAT